jgi:molecular chaperone DnaK (HSP70)
MDELGNPAVLANADGDATTPSVVYVDTMLLLGGATRMPQVVRRLRQEFGMELRFHDPDHAFAKGPPSTGRSCPSAAVSTPRSPAS